jgi:hypothetical protein
MSTSAIGRRLDSGQWSSAYPGVYRLSLEPMSDLARVWAAWLYAEAPSAHPGSGRAGRPSAFVSGEAALWLGGVVDSCPATLDLATAGRQVRRQPGLRVCRSTDLRPHPALLPPRLVLEDAVLATVNRFTSAARVVDIVLAAGQRRLTTPERLLAAAELRPRLRWRGLVAELCAELRAGVQSPLEREYERRVERTHALPRGQRNVREDAATGGAWYRDVRYRGLRCVVELDGRAAHPVDVAFRDRLRDNHAARAGDTTLRYGWRDVVGQPCLVAADVVSVLRRAGWDGAPRACGPRCAVATVDHVVKNVPLSGTKFTPGRVAQAHSGGAVTCRMR